MTAFPRAPSETVGYKVAAGGDMTRDKDAFERETLSEALVGTYLSGRCTGFAVAVHRRTGWPLVALRTREGELVHSACLSPDGRYVDARGFLDGDGVRREFEWAADVVPADEPGLLAEHPQDEQLIAQAALHAELLLDLPGRCEARDRFEAFAGALAELCDAHGIWMRGPGPGVSEAFVAYEAYGEEERFEVALMPAGGARLTRVLGRG